MPSWIVVLIVLAAASAAAAAYLVREKRSGKCSCGGNCAACRACGKKK